jgi:hypothetical protein
MTETAPSRLDDRTLDLIATAHTRTVDALAGYKTMVEKAEPEFLPTATHFRDMHDRHAARLSAMLAQHGREPDDDGSFMSYVNKMVVSARAFFDEIDEDVMKQIRDGEEWVTKSLADAEAAARPEGIAAELRTMREEIEAALRA